MEIPNYLKNWAKFQGRQEIDRVRQLRFWRWLAILGWLAFLITVLIGCNNPIWAEEINMEIIATIESSNNPKAVSVEGAIGTYQITYVVLQEYNVMKGAKYTSRDLFKPEVNKEIAYWYMNIRIPQMLRHFHKPVTLENCLISYNAGIGRVLSGKIPKETQDYILKYKRLAKQ